MAIRTPTWTTRVAIVVPVSRAIARRAAAYRAAWNLRLADAMVAATAAETGCAQLVGNDGRFARLDVSGVTYVHVDDHA